MKSSKMITSHFKSDWSFRSFFLTIHNKREKSLCRIRYIHAVRSSFEKIRETTFPYVLWICGERWAQEVWQRFAWKFLLVLFGGVLGLYNRVYVLKLRIPKIRISEKTVYLKVGWFQRGVCVKNTGLINTYFVAVDWWSFIFSYI